MGGCLFKSKTNDSAIFFPLAGWRPDGLGLDAVGNYWSHHYDYGTWPHLAYILSIDYGNTGAYVAYLPRHYGANVRAVYIAQE